MAAVTDLTERLAEEIADKVIERVAEKMQAIGPVSKPALHQADVGPVVDPDPLIPVEKLRRNFFDPPMSKFAFYGGNGNPGFVSKLEVIEIGPRARRVRLSNFKKVLQENVRQKSAA